MSDGTVETRGGGDAVVGDGSPHRNQTRQAQDSRGSQLQAGVGRSLSRLARNLDADIGSNAVMQRIVEAAVNEIGGATAAGITLLTHGQLSSPVHTGDIARTIGLAEAETGQGPCVDSSRQEVTLRSDDLGTDDRWPDWSRTATDHGIRSVLSFQLFVEDGSMGALNVYSDQADAFDDEAENTGLLLAAHAAIAMAGARRVENMNTALVSRDIIGQAKGILMERYRIDAVQAFDLLVAASHRSHRKLAVVADELSRTGQLPITAS